MAVIEFAVFHPWKTFTILVVGILLGLGVFYGYQVNAAFGAVAVEEFDTGQARSAIDTRPADAFDLDTDIAREIHYEGDFNTNAFGEAFDDEAFDAYLLVGTDASGSLADTVILALQPAGEAAPIMVSLPRDLLVWNLCVQTFTRLNAGLVGCSPDASGPELLAIMVEDYTGVAIDHLAMIDFDGFARVIDVMGGITVCVDRPTRDVKAHLDIEETGCRVVNGETALAWVRSRHPEQLIDGEWRAVAGSDFTRQRTQQDVLFQLAGKAAGVSSPAALTKRLAAVTSVVRLDSAWSAGDAIAAAWRYRGLTADSVERFSISVEEYLTSYGAQVLLPAQPFADQLSEVWTPD